MCIVDKLGYGLVSRAQLRAHFRQTVRSFARLGVQALAAGAAVTAGIYTYKQFYPPASFWTEHRLEFRPQEYAFPAGVSDQLRSEISAAAKLCTGADFWVAKISDSATSWARLRAAVPFFHDFPGPSEEISDLAAWAVAKISGTFARKISRPPRSEDGRLIYGCDANVAPPEFLGKICLAQSEISRAAENFHRDGFVVVARAPVDTRKLRDLLGVRPDYLTKNAEAFRSRSIDFGEIARDEPDAQVDVSVHARPHVTLRLTKFESEILSEISCVMPLVWELLLQQRPEKRGNFDVYISDLQLVASEPTAARTQWSAMNGNGAGLTISVPLTFHDSSEHGARLLLPGSQNFRSFSGFFSALRALLHFGGVVAYRPEISDVAISDGRLLMREQPNRSFSAVDASLVLRFDWRDARPAALENPARLAFFNFLACLLESFSFIHNYLP
jgi:hypothetical protein